MPAEITEYQELLDTDSQSHMKTAAKNAYNEQKKVFINDDQITQLIPMIHKIVQKVAIYLKPPLSYEDLVSAGTVGLVKAAHDYNPAYKTEFTTYAYIRIRGTILDELRGCSFVPAHITKQIQEATRIAAEAIETTGHLPTDEELAEKLDMSIGKLYKMFENARAKTFVSIDGSSESEFPLSSTLEATRTPSPSMQLEKAELADKLTEAIGQLNEKQRQVIILYYQQDMTMKQIAAVFNITEPRVSQIHASALFNLSIKLKK